MAELEPGFVLSPAGVALKEQIEARRSVIAIVGAGYVGLPLAVAFTEVGFTVDCIDTNSERIAAINAGVSYIPDVPTDDLARQVKAGRLRATTDAAALGGADVIIVCVPTPLTETKDPDLAPIRAATAAIATHLRAGQLIVVESTTYPGTVQELVLPRLGASGLQVGTDFFLCHSPERVDPGNPNVRTRTLNKVVGGMTPACLAIATALYDQIVARVVPVSSPTLAEVTKLFENTYRAVNIALVNELTMLCERMELDVWEVIAAAGTKGFGIQTFWPGPGVGGHCIALDPFYLAWKAREYDFAVRFIELATEINQSMPYYVRDRLVRVLGEAGRPLRGSRVLLIGVAYKRDVPDARESPALKLIQLLQKEGALALYHDPYVPQLHPEGWFKAALESVPLTPELLGSVDAVVITTDHSNLDYEAICRSASLVLDTRNATKAVRGSGARIVKL